MQVTCGKCGTSFETGTAGSAAACPRCGTGAGPTPDAATMALTPAQVREAARGVTPARAGAAPEVPAEASYRHVIAGYELLRKLGEGGMGGVFLARENSTGREVALKILRRELSRDRDYVGRLEREARLAAKLDHPNIVRAFGTGESQGYHYLAMEYVDGQNLHDVLKDRRALKEKEALEIVLRVAQALCFAHTEGIVHRDIKPDNVMIDRSGVVKLADLGLAKQVDSETALTQTGTTMGTPDYMSPEQARGEKSIDIRSDIYSLGATLFHLVTGRPPFEGPSPGVVIAKRLTEMPPAPVEINPAVSASCDRMITRMLAPHPGDRHQTPQELVIDINRVLSGQAQVGLRPKTGAPARRPTTASRSGPADHLARARFRLLAGDLREAEEACLAAVKEKPSGREAWREMVLVLLDQDRWQDAWAWADKALGMFRDDPELLAGKSLALRRLGQTEDAMRLCQAALGVSPDAALAWLSRGEGLLAEGSREAEGCFAKALGRSNERGLMHVRVARTYLRSGNGEKALSMMRLAAAELPDSALVHHLLGQVQESLQLSGPARESYLRAAELAPDNADYAAAASRPIPPAGGKVGGMLRRLLGK